ncbi:hypothetical protein ACFYVM_32135, partial [Streptomyces sp. NPDC003280]|uniref:hypothetical protein n=1 Tax=Streptomyces sp. NPDC003280 TaxID=3364680 RepID=UPI0036C2699E
MSRFYWRFVQASATESFGGSYESHVTPAGAGAARIPGPAGIVRQALGVLITSVVDTRQCLIMAKTSGVVELSRTAP